MRNVKTGDNFNSPIIDLSNSKGGSVTISSGKKENNVEVEFDKSRISKKELYVKQLLTLLFEGLMAGLTYAFKDEMKGISWPKISSLNGALNVKIFNNLLDMIIRGIPYFLIGIFIILFLISFWKLIGMLGLIRKGNIRAHMTSRVLISRMYNQMKNDVPINGHYSVKRFYKNINGNLYILKGCKCPYCEDTPIGKMKFAYFPKDKTIGLICNQNKNHLIGFDHKIKISEI